MDLPHSSRKQAIVDGDEIEHIVAEIVRRSSESSGRQSVQEEEEEFLGFPTTDELKELLGELDCEYEEKVRHQS